MRCRTTMPRGSTPCASASRACARRAPPLTMHAPPSITIIVRYASRLRLGLGHATKSFSKGARRAGAPWTTIAGSSTT